jgi:GntR family transcriptional regulator / MocR family aminotransferase
MGVAIPLLLDRSRSTTLTAQLADQFREAICRGRIAAGSRLPSSRGLADQLAIARNTAMRAYETLIIEGYVESRPASGLFAALTLPSSLSVSRDELPPLPARDIATTPLPTPAVLAPSAAASPRGGISFDFSPGAPGAAMFP